MFMNNGDYEVHGDSPKFVCNVGQTDRLNSHFNSHFIRLIRLYLVVCSNLERPWAKFGLPLP
jgi:hypothetical protein